MSVAVISGVSSELGREYINAVVEQYPLIEEFWLIDQQKQAIKSIADCHSSKTVAGITLDLKLNESYELLDKLLRENNPEIKLLINNNDQVQSTDFFTADRKKMVDMIDYNCKASSAVTRLCLPYMEDNSLIVNVASFSAFMPTPGMAAYSASRAYTLSLSRALREELKPRGINVIAVCTGPQELQAYDTSYEPENTSKSIKELPKVLPSEIAVRSLKAGRKRKAIYNQGMAYKAIHFFSKIIPHSLLVRFITM